MKNISKYRFKALKFLPKHGILYLLQNPCSGLFSALKRTGGKYD